MYDEFDLEVVNRITALERRLDSLMLPEVGWSPTYLSTPYTNDSFDGDSFSDVGTNTKIENTSWSTTIPSDAKALLIRVKASDSGSAATANVHFRLFAASDGSIATLRLDLAGFPDDQQVSQTAVVPCDSGDIWYQCNASGTDTLDVNLWCFGYWV